MGRYSIKDLEQLSGIKAHTIRIWEKRYGIVEPQRTSTNIRYYDDEDLKKIINVSLLNNSGIKISHIADMSPTEMASRVLEISDARSEALVHIENLIISMVELDEARFTGILGMMVKKFGLERTMMEVVYPFLEKIGILWQTKNINPAQEHFISNLIRQKILAAIDELPIATEGKKVMLFLHETELHELGLLFYHYIIRKGGFQTVYLGAAVPYPDLLEIAKIHRPDVLVTAMISSGGENAGTFLNRLAVDFSGMHILASGMVLKKFKKTIPNLHLFGNPLVINQLIHQL